MGSPRAARCAPCLLWLVAFGALTALCMGSVMTSRDRAVEHVAAGNLKTLITAQERFRSREGQRGYGTLADLGAVGVIDAVLAGGTKLGYAYDVRPSEDGARWLGVASPIGQAADSGHGRCHLAPNQEGVVYQSWKRPFPWNQDCAIADRSLEAYAPPPWTPLEQALVAVCALAALAAIALGRRRARPGSSDV